MGNFLLAEISPTRVNFNFADRLAQLAMQRVVAQVILVKFHFLTEFLLNVHHTTATYFGSLFVRDIGIANRSKRNSTPCLVASKALRFGRKAPG